MKKRNRPQGVEQTIKRLELKGWRFTPNENGEGFTIKMPKESPWLQPGARRIFQQLY